MKPSTGRRYPASKSGKRIGGDVLTKGTLGTLRDSLESAGIGLLLLAAVVSAISGSGPALYSTVLAAWALFPLLVGLRNTLDAGCIFMLITVGVVLVVGLAQNGPNFLLP